MGEEINLGFVNLIITFAYRVNCIHSTNGFTSTRVINGQPVNNKNGGNVLNQSQLS